MQAQQVSKNNDWRIGITWEVLVIGLYALSSLFEILADPSSTNIVAILLLGGLSYFTISSYRIQRQNLLGVAIKSTVILGFVLLATILLFAIANLMLISSGELTQDMGYLNILLIIAIFRLSLSLRKRFADGVMMEKK